MTLMLDRWIFLFIVASTGSFANQVKPNRFDPVLSATHYTGRLAENQRSVELEPRLTATDIDGINSVNGQICGYELSRFKHDDRIGSIQDELPFEIEHLDQRPILKLKTKVEQLDCENQRIYEFYIRAFDCGAEGERRYSERSSVTITVDDVNEFSPIFTHDHYTFKVYQDQPCSSCRVEATDDDCSNVDDRVCNYKIITPNVPFSINVNGSIKIEKQLTDEQYEFEVIAVDCQLDDLVEKFSEPVRVTIKRISTCKPKITDHHATKLLLDSDHSHVFESIHLEACDDSCSVDEISGVVELNTDGLDSACQMDQCGPIYMENVLIDGGKNLDEIFSFHDVDQSFLVAKSKFSGIFQSDFIIRMSLKRRAQNENEKQHIFCQSDEKLKNRHHLALLIQEDRLKLLMRKGPVSSIDKTIYPSEWTWKLSQITDDQWHSYKIFVNYPDRVDLYIDDQLITASESDFQVIKDYALSYTDGTGDKILSVGACWHARASRMVEHLKADLSFLSIEQKSESPPDQACIRNCKEYLELPDLQTDDELQYKSNVNRSRLSFRANSAETFERALKHLVYRNTFVPLGPAGQRTVSLQAMMKCLGENATYQFPLFSRRLAIDEPMQPVQIELKGDTTILIGEEDLNDGINLFYNLSIYADSPKKKNADITDCSVGTSPEFSNGERLILPDDNLDINNLQKIQTQTGLLLSGAGSIDSYQEIIRQIIFSSESPINYEERTFSLVCIGAHDHVSTNEVLVRIQVKKRTAPAAPPAAAAMSNRLVVDNDLLRDRVFDIGGENSRRSGSPTGWPVAIALCASVGLAGVLVIYLVVRIRSGHRQRRLNGDEGSSQMEWDDEIGLNITVNPLDETRKSVRHPMPLTRVEQIPNEYDQSTSDDDEDDEYEVRGEYDDENDDDREQEDDYSSEDEEHDQIRSRKHEHQLEWDDAAIQYGPKEV